MPAQGARKPVQVTPVPVKVKVARAPFDRFTDAVRPLQSRLRLPCHQLGGRPTSVMPSVYVIAGYVSSKRVAAEEGGGPFATITVTAAENDVLPAASRARAVSVCESPVEVVVSHRTAYGGARSSLPSATPSRKNCTPATPTLSEASAATVTVPLAVAPEAGDVMLTSGGVVSLNTVTVTGSDAHSIPSMSRATAVNVCGPLGVAVVFHAVEYGAVVSSVPT